MKNSCRFHPSLCSPHKSKRISFHFTLCLNIDGTWNTTVHCLFSISIHALKITTRLFLLRPNIFSQCHKMWSEIFIYINDSKCHRRPTHFRLITIDIAKRNREKYSLRDKKWEMRNEKFNCQWRVIKSSFTTL